MRAWMTTLRPRSRTDQLRLGYALAPVGVALISLGIAGVRVYAHIPNISLLYLFVILALASTVGRGPAILAALLAFLIYNFCFVEPRYTFAIHEPAEWLALLVFLLTALVAGQLTAALRERAEEARRHEHITSTLYELSRALVAKQEPDQLLAAIAAQVVAVFGVRSCAILLPDEAGRLHLHSGHAVGGAAVTPLSREEAALADRTFARHRGAEPVRAGRTLLVPLGADRPLGLLRIEEAVLGEHLLTDADHQLLATFAAQAALALEQARLAREAVRAEVLARADKLKDALLSSVSHDLRTPLASIRAAAGGLLQEDIDWDPETRREFAAAIDEEALRLNHLVGNLLEMSRIDAGALDARTELYPLDSLLHAAVARLAPVTAGRPVEVVLPADLPPVPLDPVQIDQVLGNLLENAAKHTPAGAPIAVTVAIAPEGDAVRVSVADRGPGIPPAEHARIFDKFYRLPSAAPVAGSGLGLAIARGLVEAHGGRIGIEGRPGGGARFTFTLPLSPTPTAPVERAGDGDTGQMAVAEDAGTPQPVLAGRQGRGHG